MQCLLDVAIFLSKTSRSPSPTSLGNYSEYVSGYMVMGPHYMVTNHYYSGTERIACKLVGSVDSSIDNSLEL